MPESLALLAHSLLPTAKAHPFHPISTPDLLFTFLQTPGFLPVIIGSVALAASLDSSRRTCKVSETLTVSTLEELARKRNARPPSKLIGGSGEMENSVDTRKPGEI